MTSSQPTKIVIRLRDEHGPSAETPWATQISRTGHDGRYQGHFKMDNDTVFAPFVVGDIVECTLDADSRLQVSALVEAQKVYAALILTADGRAEEAFAAVEPISLRVTRMADTLLTLVADADHDPSQALDQLVAAGVIDDWSLTRTPDEAPDDFAVDYAVSTEPTWEPVQTDYWAADDPVWRRLGVTDPGMLTFIQTTASQDARVARALENGRHDQVLTFLDRIAALNRGEKLPPLDGPIFTDETSEPGK